MNNPLSTYLRDHYAGSRLAIDLLDTLRDRHAGEPLGDFVAELLVEVQHDRMVLKRLVDRVGSGRLTLVKESLAYVIEKASWLKLRGRASGALGTLEGLETIAIGILGKLALWRALSVAAVWDDRLNGIDFDELADRAVDQHAQVEERRLEAVRELLGPATT